MDNNFESIRSQLTQAGGLSWEHIQTLHENEIDSQEFYSLTIQDLLVMYPNKLGVAKKVFRIVSNNNNEISSPASASNAPNSSDLTPISAAPKPNSAQTPAPEETELPAPTPELATISQEIADHKNKTELIGGFPEFVTQNAAPVAQTRQFCSRPRSPTQSDFSSSENPEFFRDSAAVTRKRPTLVVRDLPVVRQVTAPKRAHRFIAALMSCPGKFLNELVSYPHSVQILIPRANARSDPELIQVKGALRPVQLVIEEFRRISEESKNYVTKTLQVAQDLQKYVIGAKGQNIREVLQRTGIFVVVPPRDSARGELVTLTGLPEYIDQALDMVQRKFSRFAEAAAGASEKTEFGYSAQAPAPAPGSSAGTSAAQQGIKKGGKTQSQKPGKKN